MQECPTCTTIVGPMTADTRPMGRSTSSGRISTSNGGTSEGKIPGFLHKQLQAWLQRQSPTSAAVGNYLKLMLSDRQGHSTASKFLHAYLART